MVFAAWLLALAGFTYLASGFFRVATSKDLHDGDAEQCDALNEWKRENNRRLHWQQRLGGVL